jgi:predicted anti-sigma-YlaC factor YlaD
LKKLDCDSVLEQLSDFIDQETRDELCEQIQEHLARCKDCQVQVDKVKRTILLYQSGAEVVKIPVQAHSGLRAALATEYGGGAKPRG